MKSTYYNIDQMILTTVFAECCHVTQHANQVGESGAQWNIKIYMCSFD